MVGLEFLVYQEVVHGAAVRVAHHAVEDLSGDHSPYLVGKNMVHEGLCIGAFHEDFSHVGHVEHAHLPPYGIVFRHDAFVLDGHHESGEGAHLGSQGHVGIVQAGALQILNGNFNL